MGYTPSFTPQYENGWEDLPSETSPITAEAFNAYDDAIENVEEYLASDESQANLADAYDETATYEAGDYVIYGGDLYKCLEDIDTPEEWDSTKWESCLITNEMATSGGTTVIANPSGEATETLTKLQVENTIYGISGGGGNANIWTGTQAELEEVFDELEEGTQINITDDEQEVVEGGTIYSEEEQVIGVWIDNKPLYQKSLVIPFSSFTSIQSGARYIYTFAQADEDIKDIEGYALTTNYSRCYIGSRNYEDNSTYTNNYWEFANYYSTLNLTFVGTGASTIGVKNVYITYKYTKSTDAPLDTMVSRPITYNLANGYADYSNKIYEESYTTTSADYNYEYTATEDCFVVFSNVNGANRDSYARVLKGTEILAEVFVSYSSQLIQCGGSTFLRKGEKLLVHSTYQNAQLSIKVYGIKALGVKPVINYSTDEQVIGTYVDGKPIYRKSFTYSSGSLSTGSLTLTNNLSNVERVIDKHCQIHAGADDRDYDIPYFRADYNESVFLLCHVLTDHTVTTALLSNDHVSYTNLTNIVITLEYTKTTD